LRYFNWLVVAISLLVLTACGLTPGMHLSESGYKEDRVDVIDINSEFVARQLQEQARAVPATQANNLLKKQIENYQYRVGPHDVLQITIWDHPELTIPAGQFRNSADTGNLVRSDGSIFYPFVGVVHVSGKTVEQIRVMLTRGLSSDIKSPQVDVRVASYRSQKVYVTGEVAKPGVLPITDTPLTVLDAINEAGGIKPIQTVGDEYEADLQNVILTRNGREYRINLLALYSDGNIGQNYLLQGGDSLHVPDNNFKKVFVLGEVKDPKSLRIHNGRITLAEAIGDVQGFDLNSANTSRVYVIRGSGRDRSGKPMPWKASTGNVLIYKLDAGSADALILADQFRLQPRDVVFVATHAIADWGRTLNHLSTTMQAIAVGLAARR